LASTGLVKVSDLNEIQRSCQTGKRLEIHDGTARGAEEAMKSYSSTEASILIDGVRVAVK
jgi:hypothetical protein